MRKSAGRRARRAAPVQQSLPFLRRIERRERLFKAAIVAATATAAVALLAGSPDGRVAVADAAARARRLALRPLGLRPTRRDVEAEHRRRRRLGVAHTRAALARTLARERPEFVRFMEAARMGPDSAVIRWGNYRQALVLSSAVFEPDDAGRSYRLRPATRSIWLVGLSLDKVSALFEIPDTPEARDAGAALGGRVVPGSVQTTNSWGCRGPEPDLDAPLRVLVVGDSFMQGLLVGDDQTAPAALERRLEEATGAPASVLNAGVLGYSLEQYYFTLEALGDRFRPHAVVVGVCGNDFGPEGDAEARAEDAYWADRIAQYCRTRELLYLFVPAPGEDALLGWRDESVYPGRLSSLLKTGGAHYLYPVEPFTDEEIRLRAEARRLGRPFAVSPLFNRHLMGDNHFSPRGCALWAESVARRLLGLRDREALLYGGRHHGRWRPAPAPARSEDRDGPPGRAGAPSAWRTLPNMLGSGAGRGRWRP